MNDVLYINYKLIREGRILHSVYSNFTKHNKFLVIFFSADSAPIKDCPCWNARAKNLRLVCGLNSVQMNSVRFKSVLKYFLVNV
jgi:hypothetical protein